MISFGKEGERIMTLEELKKILEGLTSAFEIELSDKRLVITESKRERSDKLIRGNPFNSYQEARNHVDKNFGMPLQAHVVEKEGLYYGIAATLIPTFYGNVVYK
jgi:hypothetical protein